MLICNDAQKNGVVDMAALEKVKREIVSHIDTRHYEWFVSQEVMFDRLRAEVLRSLSGSSGNSENAAEDDLNEYKPASVRAAGKAPELPNKIPVRSVALRVCGDLCCGPPSCDLWCGDQSEPKSGQASRAAKPFAKPPAMPDGDETKVQEDIPDKDEAHEPPGEDSFEEKQSRLQRTRSKQAKDGQPQGQFFGRGNLFAFMQAKNWDSEACQHPEAINDNIEEQEKEWMDNVDADANTSLPDSKEKCSADNGWHSKLKSVVQSTRFDLIIGLFIVVNALVMGLQLEYEGTHSAYVIGVPSDEGNWPNADDAFHALEHLFVIVFCAEVALRVLAMGHTYFKQAFNCLDFVVVASSVLENYILPAVGSDMMKMSFLRLLRVLKLLRVLRVVRLLKVCENLRVLVMTCSHSMWSLVWSMLLLSVVQVIASIFMTQSLQSYLQDETQDPEERASVYVFFGTFTRSSITLFEMTLAIGTWGRCGRILIFSVSRYYALFFIGYLFLVSFGMIRVIGAIFLKDTLASTAKEASQSMCLQNRNPQFVADIWNQYIALDEDGNGHVSLREVNAKLDEPEAIDKLRGFGVKSHELKGLLSLMDDGDGEISFCEYLTGIMRLRNAGQGVDLATFVYENKKLLKRMLGIGTKVDDTLKQLHGIERKVSQLAGGKDVGNNKGNDKPIMRPWSGPSNIQLPQEFDQDES